MKDVEKYLETNYDNGIFTEKVNIVDAMIMISHSIEKVAFVLNDVASALNKPSEKVAFDLNDVDVDSALNKFSHN